MPVGGYQELAYGPLVAVGRGQAEGGDDSFWGHRKRHLESVDPLRFRDASAEGCLSGEQALAARSYSHNRRDQGGVEQAVNVVVIGDRASEVALQYLELRLEGADAPVELALGKEVGEACPEMRVGEPPEVTLASPPGPLRQYRQGNRLPVGDCGAAVVWIGSEK